MKTYWSAFLSLLFLLVLGGCGSEQFGTTPSSSSPQANPLTVYQQNTCSGHTLIKPIVDVLYVVDNSTSNYYISNSVKTGIQNTINSISSQFDYRVIGTPLIATENGNEDYQVLAKDPSTLPASAAQKTVTSSSQFSFFNNYVQGSLEPGLDRVRSFITAHQNDGLFRQGAYLFVVLVSNGYDTDIETVINVNGQTGYTTNGLSIYNQRKTSFLQLKSYLNSQQFRIFSVVAHTPCQSGWKASSKSYVQMSKDLYNEHPGLTDQNSNPTPDSYNLCSGASAVFASVNSSIQQIVVPHTYKYWPITSTTGAIDTNPGKIKVYKVSPGAAPVEMTSGWSYLSNPGTTNTRILPTVGEPTTLPHLIEFDSSHYITYPDCVSITTLSNLEYFGYIALPKIPRPETVKIIINGSEVPSSAWTLESGFQTKNIKVAHNGYPSTPAVIREGYMIKLNSTHYYKSGDNVEVYYLPVTN